MGNQTGLTNPPTPDGQRTRPSAVTIDDDAPTGRSTTAAPAGHDDLAAAPDTVGIPIRWWWTILGTSVLASLVFGLVLGYGDSETIKWTDDLATIVTPALAAAACWWRATHSADHVRRAWTWLGAAAASWAIGESVWSWYELALAAEVPTPSLADLFFLITVPCAVIGVLQLSTNLESRLSRSRSLLDGLVIACSLLFVSWSLVLGPIYQETSDDKLGWLVLLAYPAGDVVIVTVAFIALSRARDALRMQVVLISLWMVAFGVADSSFVYLVQEGTYNSGNQADVGWFAGFLLLMLAALLPAPTSATQRTPLAEDAAPSGRGGSGSSLTTTQIVLPYLPLIPAALSAVILAIEGIAFNAVMVVLAAAVAGLVVTRQLVLLFENQRLAGQLEELVSELRTNEQALAHQVTHDRLTGLANRALFSERLEHALARQDRTGLGHAVLLCDLDGFKLVNDTLGHLAGDEVLAIAADRMHQCVRPMDTVARFGGDEFAVLIEDAEDLASVRNVAGRIVAAVAEPMPLQRQNRATVHVSIGGLLSDPGAEPDDLLRRADIALYEAKADGGDRYRIFEASMLGTALERERRHATTSGAPPGPDDERGPAAQPDG